MEIDETIRKTADELSTLGRDGFLLYAMGLKFKTTDYEKLFRDHFTDGRNDKKIDFFYLDRDAGTVTIAQSYKSPDWNKPQPPSNKASDLNTGINWLLDSDIDKIPEDSIKAQAIDLRDALNEHS